MKIVQITKTVSRSRAGSFGNSRRHSPALALIAPLATLGLTVYLAPAVRAGTWQMTVTSTNSEGSTGSSSLTNIAVSNKTMLAVALIGAGSTSTTLTGQATASYSGTYTFTWVPSGPSDWPSAYTVTSMRSESHASSMLSASGSVSTSTTGSGSSAVTLPGTYSGSLTVTPTSTVDTSVTNLTVTTTALTKTSTVVDSSGAVTNNDGQMTFVSRAYNAAYFPAHFSTPASVVLTYSVSAATTQANCSYSSSSTDAMVTASASIMDIFSGQ